MNYTLTVKQIESLAHILHAHHWDGLEWEQDDLDVLLEYRDRARKLAASVAFQAIIRTAQAEAFDRGATCGFAYQVGADDALTNPFDTLTGEHREHH